MSSRKSKLCVLGEMGICVSLGWEDFMLHILRNFIRAVTVSGIIFAGAVLADAKSDYATAVKRIEIAVRSGAKTLDLSELYQLKDIPEDIRRLTELNRLNLSYTRISSLKILQSLPQLEHLVLRATGLGNEDILPLASMTGLKSLNLRQNLLWEIKPLMGLKALIWLDLSSNDLPGIDELEELAQLEELDISFNEIAFISILLKHPKLRNLSISHMTVDDVDIIGQFTELEELNIGYSEVVDLSFVLQLPKLKIFWYEMERVTADKVILGILTARGVRVIPY